MTVNRASAISVKRELLPVLWVQLKAVVFNVLVPPSFEKRKKAKTNYLLCKALQLDSLVHNQPAGRQNRNIISIILTFSPAMYSFYDKILFWSRPLHADSFSPKAVRGKSSYPHDCYFLRSKTLQTWNIFSSAPAIFSIDFQISMA